VRRLCTSDHRKARRVNWKEHVHGLQG
jgi:hypothetical protein